MGMVLSTPLPSLFPLPSHTRAQRCWARLDEQLGEAAEAVAADAAVASATAAGLRRLPRKTSRPSCCHAPPPRHTHTKSGNLPELLTFTVAAFALAFLYMPRSAVGGVGVGE